VWLRGRRNKHGGGNGTGVRADGSAVGWVFRSEFRTTALIDDLERLADVFFASLACWAVYVGADDALVCGINQSAMATLAAMMTATAGPQRDSVETGGGEAGRHRSWRRRALWKASQALVDGCTHGVQHRLVVRSSWRRQRRPISHRTGRSRCDAVRARDTIRAGRAVDIRSGFR